MPLGIWLEHPTSTEHSAFAFRKTPASRFSGNGGFTGVISRKAEIRKSLKHTHSVPPSLNSPSIRQRGNCAGNITSLTVALLLLCITSFFLGCSESREVNSRTNNDAPGNVLRFDVYEPFYSLSPAELESGVSGSGMIFPFLYSYLFIPNDKLEAAPDLATSWDYDPRNFTWNIRIREDAHFHGIKRRVIADDVKYSLETILKSQNPSAMESIERIACLDEHSLMIVLKTDCPDFLRNIWTVEIMARPDGQHVNHVNHPIGSGPFQFSYRKGKSEVGLVANEAYYRGRPSLDGVVFYFKPDKEQSWARFLSGKTDIVLGMHPEDYEMIKLYEDQFYFSTNVEPFRTLLLYNTTDPFFADSRVRLALAYAIDKEYIIKVILCGLGIEAVGTMGQNSPYRNPELQPIPYDPEKSLQLLQQAGWSFHPGSTYLQKQGKCFEFTISFHSESQLHERLAQYLRLCLNKLGIKTHLQAIPYLKFRDKLCDNNTFQAVIAEYAEVNSDTYLEKLWCPIHGKKAWAGGFDHPHVNRLVSKVLREKDTVRKNRLIYELDSLLISLQPATFLYQRISLNGLSNRFHLDPSFSSVFFHFHLWSLSLAAERPFPANDAFSIE